MQRAILAAGIIASLAVAVSGHVFVHGGDTLTYIVEGPAGGDIAPTLRKLIEECEVEGCDQEEIDESVAILRAAGATNVIINGVSY